MVDYNVAGILYCFVLIIMKRLIYNCCGIVSRNRKCLLDENTMNSKYKACWSVGSTMDSYCPVTSVHMLISNPGGVSSVGLLPPPVHTDTKSYIPNR